jgi:hypothetical protein
MARIDLINLGKTLRDRAGSGDGAGIPAGGGRGSTFSIRNLTLTVPDGQTMVVLGPADAARPRFSRSLPD